jgi:hypothetical protein
VQQEPQESLAQREHSEETVESEAQQVLEQQLNCKPSEEEAERVVMFRHSQEEVVEEAVKHPLVQ